MLQVVEVMTETWLPSHWVIGAKVFEDLFKNWISYEVKSAPLSEEGAAQAIETTPVLYERVGAAGAVGATEVWTFEALEFGPDP